MLLIEDLIQKELIPNDRKDLIKKLALDIKSKNLKTIVFVCTHNSRRSQFAQFFAWYYNNGFNLDYEILSAGTEKTACYLATAEAIRGLGFDYHPVAIEGQKAFRFIENDNELVLSSKTIQDIQEPAYYAVMTCGDAEENCPYIPEAKGRGALKYKDPKWSDGTDESKQVYQDTAVKIASEVKLLMEYLR